MKRREIFMKTGAALLAATLCMTTIATSGLASAPDLAAGQEQDMIAGFDFDSGIDGWHYGNGWEYNYSAKDASSVEADAGQLKFNVDYTEDKDKEWSQTVAVWEPQNGKGLNLSEANSVSMKMIYDASKMSAGSLAVSVYCDEGLDAGADADFSAAQDLADGRKQVEVSISFDALGAPASDVKKFALKLIGKTMDYKGAVWFDDIQIRKEAEPDTSIDSSIAVKSAAEQQVKVSAGKLITQKKDGSTQKTEIASEVSLADPSANLAARRIYAYLKAVGSSDSVIYGHQNDISHKAGNAELSSSDTKDVTGSVSGIFGIDTLSLTGNEYSAERYNKEFHASLEITAENHVKAAAELTNAAVREGAIVTLSAHMPNFANVKKNAGYKSGDPTYAKYDFSGYSPNVTANDPVNRFCREENITKCIRLIWI